MDARQLVLNLKHQIEEQIWDILMDKYEKLHNKKIGKLEVNEEIYLTSDEVFPSKFELHWVEYSTYDESQIMYKVEVNKYILTSDYGLIFEVGEDEEEYDCTEFDIYDLANLLDTLNRDL